MNLRKDAEVRQPAKPAIWALRFHKNIKEISPGDWNCCADPDYPTVSYAYLSSLEDSGCVSKERGFIASHLTVRNADTDEICAVMPGYFKRDSMGELGLDYQWWKFYRGPARKYYPKYQSEVPFTPVTAPKLLINPACQDQLTLPVIFARLCRYFGEKNLSSFHMSFADGDQVTAINDPGVIHQTHLQFHWFNKEYGSFDDFLGLLTSNCRKAIKHERKRVQAEGLEFINIEGPDITPAQMDFMFDVYLKTNREYNEPAYLNRQFFDLLLQRLPENIILFMALKNGEPIAANFALKSGGRIFSRYWGCVKFVKFLHFEMSYYRIMEYAIANNIGYFDGGAAGFHKKGRAMEPVDIHHLHWINDPGFQDKAQKYLDAVGAYWQKLRHEHQGKRIYRISGGGKS